MMSEEDPEDLSTKNCASTQFSELQAPEPASSDEKSSVHEQPACQAAPQCTDAAPAQCFTVLTKTGRHSDQPAQDSSNTTKSSNDLMLLVDMKNCPTDSRSQGIKSICVNKQAEVSEFKQMLKELMHLPEPSIVKIYQNNAGNDTLDEQASVADIGLRHLDRLTLQAPVLCAGMKF